MTRGKKKIKQEKTTRHSDDDKSIMCFMCSVEEKWSEHKESKQHLSKIRFFVQSFIDVSSSNVRCKLCKSLVPKPAFQKHASEKHQLIPWYRPKDEFTTYWKNGITNVGEEYRCHFCDKTHSCWYVSIAHVGNKSHQKVFEDHVRLNDSNTIALTEKICQQFVTNGIVLLTGTQLLCWTCDCHIVGHENADKHIAGETHLSNLAEKCKKVSGKCNLISTTEEPKKDKILKCFENFIMKRHVDYYCNLCNNNCSSFSSVISHIENPEHQNLLLSKRQRSIGDIPFKATTCKLLVKNNIFQLNTQQLECYSCKSIISSYCFINDHLNSRNHKNNLGFISAQENISVPAIDNTDGTSSEGNDIMENNLPQPPELAEDFPEYFDNFIEKRQDNYYCHLCNIKLHTSSAVMTHLDNQEHKNLARHRGISKVVDGSPRKSNYCKLFVKNGIFKSDTEILKCYICKCLLGSYEDAVKHTSDSLHKTQQRLPFDFQLPAARESNETQKYPDYLCVKYREDDEKVLTCFICSVEDSWKNHKEDKDHLSKLRFFFSTYVDCPGDHVICKLCNNNIPKGSVIEHAGKKHHVIPWYRPKDEFVTYFNNFIRPIDNKYYCYLCNKIMKDWYLALEHVNGSRHSGSVKMFFDDKDIDKKALSRKLNKTFVANSIFPFTFTHLRCWSCNFIIEYKNVEEHIASDEHMKRIKIIDVLESTSEELDKVSICDDPETGDVDSSAWEIGVNNLEDGSIFSGLEKSIDCNVSPSSYTPINIETININDSYNEDHNDSISIQSTESYSAMDNKFLKFFENHIGRSTDSFYCYLCYVHLSSEYLALVHIDETQHQLLKTITFGFDKIDVIKSYPPEAYERFIDNFIFPKNNINNTLECSLCQVSMPYTKGEIHINSNQHAKESLMRIDNLFRGKNISAGTEIVPETTGAKFDGTAVKEHSDDVIDSLGESEDHFFKYFENYISKRENYYYCYLCNKTLSSSSLVMAHIDHPIHRNLLEIIAKTKQITDLIPQVSDLCELFVTNDIFRFNNDDLKCFSCKCRLDTCENAVVHIESQHEIKNNNSGSIKSSVKQKPDLPQAKVTVDNQSVITASQLSEAGSVRKTPTKRKAQVILDNNNYVKAETKANGHNQEIPLSELEDMTIKCFKNFIFVRKNLYYCNLCEIFIFNYERINLHINEPVHQDRVKQKRKMKKTVGETLYLPNFYEQLVRSNVFENNFSSLYCFTCKCNISSYKSAEEHIHGRNHEINNAEMFSKEEKSPSVSIDELVLPQLPESRHCFVEYWENLIEKRRSDYYCHLCQINLSSSFEVTIHINRQDHGDLVKLRKGKIYTTVQNTLYLYELSVRNAVFQEKSSTLRCFKCKVPVHLKNAETHILGPKHKTNFKLLSSSEPETSPSPSKTSANNNKSVVTNNQSSISNSFNKSKSSNSSQVSSADEENTSIELSKPLTDSENQYLKCFENFIFIRDSDYYCNLCKKYLLTSSSMLSHINHTDHNNLLIKKRQHQDIVDHQVLYLPTFVELLVRHNIFQLHYSTLKCLSCQCTISGYVCAEEHINGLQHKNRHVLYSSKENVSADFSLKTKDEFTLYLINFIEKRHEDFYCNLCHVDLPSSSSVKTHIKKNDHRNLVKNRDLTLKFKNQNTLYFTELCIRNSLFQVNSIELKCFKCNKFFELNKINAEEHVQSLDHKTKCQLVVGKSSGKQENSSTLSGFIPNNKLPVITNEQVSESVSKLSGFKFSKLAPESDDLICKYFNNYIFVCGDGYYCNLCELKLSSLHVITHIENPFHQSLVKLKRQGKNIINMPTCMSNDVEELVKNNIFQIDSTSLSCFTCDCSINSVFNAREHINSEKHKANIKCEIIKILKAISYDILSNAKAVSNNSEDIAKPRNKLSESESDFYQYFVNFIIKDRRDYFCYACLKSMNSLSSVNTHMEKEVHKNKVIEKKKSMNIIINIPRLPNVYEKLVRNNIIAYSLEKLKCHTCHFVLPSFLDADLHIDCKVHKHKHGVITVKSSGNQDIYLAEPQVFDDQSASSSNQSAATESIPSNQILNISDTKPQSPLTITPAQLSAAELKESKVTSQYVLSREIYKYNDTKRSLVICNVCCEKLDSRVLLHVHLSGHFWRLFTNENVQDLMSLLNLNSEIKIFFSNDENSEQVVSSLITTEKKNALLRYHSKSAGNQSSNKVGAGSRQLWMSKTDKKAKKVDDSQEDKKRGYKNDLSHIDIYRSETSKRFDIYEVDEELHYSNQLSLSRIFIINKDEIYCMVCRKRVPFSQRIVYEHFRSIEHSYFLVQMVQDHMKFEGLPDEFSDLHLAREMMEDKSDRHVVCYVCDPVKPAVIPNTNDALEIHINQFRHRDNKIKLSNNLQKFISDFNARLEYSWFNVQKYWCVICSEQFKFEKKFYSHLNSKNHHKKCAKLVEFEKLLCDFCPTCGLLFYGFKNTFDYHSDCESHKYYADRSFYFITRLPTAVEELLINAEEVMSSKMETLEWEFELMKQEEESLIKDLEKTIKDYVDAKIHVFGSRKTGLGTMTSDLDIFLDCDDLYQKGTDDNDTSIFLREVEHSLKRNEDIWTINRTVLDCRVPIIKITHKLTGIDCDISFKNGLTVENSKMIKTYVDKYPLCKKLILFIKDWINLCNLNGESGICNYAVAWMVIYYLQTKFILPNVAELIKLEGKSQRIGGWETGASKDFTLPDISNIYNFKDLLRGFFIMCAGFDYRNNIFCPLLGRPIKKIDFVMSEKLEDLPDEMEPYKNYVNKNKKAESLRLDSVVAVQDPFDLSNNLTKAVKKSTMYRFKTYSSLSAKKLMIN
ncbi:uncharacterized protein LOC130669891 [Microplitis mediator]|uniref:uncharacterized protein LOC130669891 n=1 Tax=Microplitis mediator TaxID=375433 RepID=UPI002552E464|nr:uncharacterized protein LOC130669891 [Microplitis mediator]